MKIFYIALIPLLITACTPHTIGGVREVGPSKTISFDVPENYESTYRKLLDQQKHCNNFWMLTAQMVAEGDLFPDKKLGTISVSLRGGLGSSYYQVIDIKEINPSNSNVTAYYSVGSPDKYGKLLKQWALDNYKECTL